MMESRTTPTHASAPSRSVAELLSETASHTEAVVRGEIRLAVMRVQEQVASKARRVMLFSVSGVLGLLALILLLVAAVLLLGQWMAAWLATAIVGLGVTLAAGIVLAFAGREPEGST